MMPRRLLALLVSLLIVAACGDTTEEEPSATGAGDDPAVAGACPVEEPDCVDTVAGGQPVDAGGAVSGVVVDGGLTVPEALATDATGILAVQGYLFADDHGWRLCEVLAESHPPQCGGGVLPLGDFDRSTVDALPDAEIFTLHEAEGTTWSDRYVLVFGDIVDGVLLVNTQVAG